MPHLPLHIERTSTRCKLCGCHITSALVRRYPLPFYSSFFAETLKQLGYPFNRQRLATIGEEHRVLFSCDCTTIQRSENRTIFCQVLVQRLKPIIGNRHLLPPVPLAMHQEHPQVTVNITQAQTCQLLTSYSCIDQDAHNRPIASGHRFL